MYVNIFMYKKQQSIRAETGKTLSVLLGGWKGPSNLFGSNSFQTSTTANFFVHMSSPSRIRRRLCYVISGWKL